MLWPAFLIVSRSSNLRAVLVVLLAVAARAEEDYFVRAKRIAATQSAITQIQEEVSLKMESHLKKFNEEMNDLALRVFRKGEGKRGVANSRTYDFGNGSVNSNYDPYKDYLDTTREVQADAKSHPKYNGEFDYNKLDEKGNPTRKNRSIDVIARRIPDEAARKEFYDWANQVGDAVKRERAFDSAKKAREELKTQITGLNGKDKPMSAADYEKLSGILQRLELNDDTYKTATEALEKVRSVNPDWKAYPHGNKKVSPSCVAGKL